MSDHYKITHTSFVGGRVQSIGHHSDLDEYVEYMLIAPGKYDLGPAPYSQGVMVITGELVTPDGKTYSGVEDEREEELGLICYDEGEPRRFSAAVPTSCLVRSAED